MPKRQCPFSESNRPQLKTHVGLIELSSGVMGPQMMNNVYDRTLKLMYQNARKTDIETHKENMALNNRCDDGMDTRMDYTQPQSPRVQPGQRKLTFCGQLDSHYLQGQDKNIMAHAQTEDRFLPITCSSCRNIPSVARTCSFCERCLCEMCHRCCHACSLTTCSDCSTIRYKPGENEKYLCLSCV